MGDYVQTGCLILGILCFFYYFTHCHVCRDHCGLCMDLGSGRHCISGDPGAAGFSGFLFGGNASLAEAVCAVCMAAGFAAGILMGSRIVHAMAEKTAAGAGLCHCPRRPG